MRAFSVFVPPRINSPGGQISLRSLCQEWLPLQVKSENPFKSAAIELLGQMRLGELMRGGTKTEKALVCHLRPLTSSKDGTGLPPSSAESFIS